MDIGTYSTLALRTAPSDSEFLDDLVHSALGIGGESGEIIDYVKKSAFNQRPINKNVIIEEIGDLMWYLNLMVAALDTTWNHVLSVNIAKLEARYPDLKFDAERSLNRDLDAEKVAMESV